MDVARRTRTHASRSVAVTDGPGGSPTAGDTSEATGHAGSTAWVRTTGGFGMIVFLASDVMLFAPFFAAYYVLRGTTDVWPPPGVELDVWRAVAATVVLVASSLTLVVADRALGARRRESALRWQLVTVALGTAFVVNQLAEYTTLSFGADSHPYGSAFWVLTGLHGVHVVAGVFAIAMLFVRTARAPEPELVEPFAAGVSAYWHMVDVVWIGVFATIWLVR